jgi:uncharacterized protein YdhG (YjbR/CyaY superfamily)
METKTTTAKDLDEYISRFPSDVQRILEELRATIKKAAPDAEEVISYQMPAFKFNGMLVYFAGYKNHIGFYPTSSGIEAFSKELSVYKGAKGSVQFPIDSQLPLNLISKIVKYRVRENLEKANAKKK